MNFIPLRRVINKTVYIVSALIIFLCLPALPSYAANFAVTSPWIGVIASFIGGSKINVHYLSIWDANGKVIGTSRARANEKIIALDVKDAAKFGIKKNNKKLYLLYDKLPMTQKQLYSAFFDPATLPFIAQSVMQIIAEDDKPGYSYYQRRLAEFQSRIESTIDIGRHLLKEKKMLDLTGAEGSWIRSAVPGVVRAPANVWDEWEKGDQRSLKAALDEAKRRHWLVLLDPWTPDNIRIVAAGYENRITLPPPSKNQDYFVFLHEIFLVIFNKTKT